MAPLTRLLLTGVALMTVPAVGVLGAAAGASGALGMVTVGAAGVTVGQYVPPDPGVTMMPWLPWN